MTTDHGITLDEQIRWLDDMACEDLRLAQHVRRGECARDVALNPEPWERAAREEASMCLTIANTLRAERARLAPAQD